MIHPHNWEHMKKILNHKGIAFIIVRFSYYDETYLIFAKDLFEFINSTKRKSIPYSWFKEKVFLLPYSYQIKVDYLSVRLTYSWR